MGRKPDSARKESHLKLRLALRAARIGIWDWNIETNEMRYSPRARALCGFPPDRDVTFDMVRDVTHPEDYPRTSAMARSALDPALRTKEPYEYRIVRADTGEVRWVLAHGEAVFANGGNRPKAVRYIGTIQDITERKRNEDALRDAELRQRLAIDAARLAVWELDIATEEVKATPELNKLFGLPPDAKPTLDELRQFYAEGEREKVQVVAQAALAEGRTHFEIEYRIRWPDGSPHWLLLRAEIIFQDDRPHRVIGVLADIDQRKRHEEQQMLMLRELNHRVKNSLSVVQSLATQSFKGGKADPVAMDTFRQRLQALASANDMLLKREWGSFDLRGLIEAIVAPYDDPPGRVAIVGPKQDMPPRLNVPLALTLHELCTNGAKYGALSAEAGSVRVSWERTASGIVLEWVEEGGPEVVPPVTSSFGMRLISDVLAIELGKVELEMPATGVRCRIAMPL
ncbi:MAG: HWE histidine kinase domain-containing protein [Rhizobiaceae bacterium]